ncbi:unnamed protein product [Zymoseptoria tritici ST99CH_3D1]|nr:unnamed protein product [Zymoseptoria tritici ST99CH_3D1]
MAPKGKGTLLELCTSTTIQGNSIAVHVLEYLSIAQTPPLGFREVAVEFLEVSRVLFTARAGLSDATGRTTATSTVEVNRDFHEKVNQTKNVFTIYDQMVNKLLSTEKKQTFGKLGKGLRLMFADGDMEKLRVSFSQCRAALSLAGHLFPEARAGHSVESASTIGYTALAAVMERVDPSRPASSHAVLPKTGLPPSPPPTIPLPSAPQSMRSETRSPPVVANEPWTHMSPVRSPAESTGTASTSRSHATFASSLPRFSNVSSMIGGGHGDNVFGTADNMSDITDATSIISRMDISDTTRQSYANGDKLPKQAIRMKIDPTKAQRWAPKRTVGNITEAAKTALATAVHQKHHKMIEQLLDQGVPANSASGNNLLCDAVINHDLESVRLLLLFGADANGTDKDNCTPLYAATGASFFEAAQLLINYNANPNQSAGMYGESPFAVSLSDAKAPFAHMYLQYGADPSAVMENGDTAFTQSMNKYTPSWLIELMLLYSTPVDAKNARGETALFKAINSARLDLVSKLLSARADPNLPGPKIVLWPAVHHPAILEELLTHGADLRRAPGVLELATSTNSTEAVNILLHHGADTNAKKDNIYTPLCSAIRDDREALVETLLAAGADPNLKALDWPLFKAVSYHRTHMIPRLLAAGADPHHPKGLIESAVAHENMPALNYLLRQNIDPNARNAKGYTALTTAIRDNHPEYIDVLLAHGADPSVRGQDWPISMAVKRPAILAKLLPHIQPSKILPGAMELAVVADQLESVRLLVNAGMDPESKNGGVFSPLTTAIRENRKEIFRYLVDEAGADVNTPGEHLPIIKAIRRHREEDLSYISHLLENGANVNLMYRGWNAVLQALENGDLEILKLLMEKGRPGPDLDQQDDSGRSVRDIIHERDLIEEEEILMGRRGEVVQLNTLEGGGKTKRNEKKEREEKRLAKEEEMKEEEWRRQTAEQRGSEGERMMESVTQWYFRESFLVGKQ